MAKRHPERIQKNKHGIPINKRLNLELLIVAGAEDPFEGVKWDPQFDKEPKGRQAHERY
jgi:hypothetical protein